MSKKIFRSIMSVALLILITSVAFIMGILYNYFENQILSELESEAGYIARAVEAQGAGYIDGFKGSEKRITLISPNGTVIADTSADPAALDNHAERKEVKEALAQGSGTSIRYSDTLTEKTVYYAARLENGNVLRVSATQYSAAAAVLALIHPLLTVLVIAAVLSFILSRRVTKSIIKPINEIDLDNPENAEAYEELTPLLNKISVQNRTIREQLREAEKKREEFRLITENMNEGFLVIDKQTNLLTHNKAALRLLGIEEASGSVLTLNRAKGFRLVIEKALKGQRAESDISLDDHNYSLIANPVYENERVIGAVIIILDVTESAKREQLRREFTSNVSHELKTPLTSISGFAEIMMAGGVSEETVKDFSKSVYDEAQRLITLVSDIIKISEFDEGSVRFQKEAVDLYEISASVIERLKPAAAKKNVTMSLIGGKTEFFGVRSIIEEMIFNLCDNAVKYNRDGGTVDVILNVSDGKINVTVRDTGIGIPYADQGRVFERFYRVDKSHSKAIGGTGLGLSIVKHGALYHGAEIGLESAQGKGTAVTVGFKRN